MQEKINKLTDKLNQLEMDWWINHDLFSFQWWIILIVNVVFFILFLTRIFEISITFIIAFVLVGIIDDIGEYFGLWDYPHQFIQFTARFNAVDFALVPSIIALIFQMFSKWRYFLIADFSFSSINSFIGVPIFVYLGLYKLHNWNYLYSFLTLFVAVILVKIIVDFIGGYKLTS